MRRASVCRPSPMAYATAADIETRLKTRLGRPFTADEIAAAEFLCEGASAVIDVCHGKSELADPPTILKFVAVEVVCRAMANPSGLQSEQEGLGAYTHAERYVSDGNLWLKEIEENMVRRAVHGRLSGSSEAASLASDLCTICRLAPSACRCADLEEACGS
jgi:hypothetical protein